MRMPPVGFRASLKSLITKAAESPYNCNFLSELFEFIHKIQQEYFVISYNGLYIFIYREPFFENIKASI